MFDGGVEAVHVGLVLVQVDPAQVGEVIPAELLPQAEAVWRGTLLLRLHFTVGNLWGSDGH